VPLELMEKKNEDVMAKLERVAMRPERILAGQVAAVPDANTGEIQGRRVHPALILHETVIG
jgi:hypothetical protein